MTISTENNKRIAKNTLYLYLRMFLMMIITLYTSRIVLNALDIEDYGIYTVIGGFVAMFGILSSSLSVAISRFITYELGRGDSKKLERIFSTTIIIQFIIAVVILILLETIGYWFLNNHMTISTERIVAANWVLQFSILTFVINIISVPYNATIIAHEHMAAYAYISILNALGTLIIAWIISIISTSDLLIIYAGLLCILALIIRLIYSWYCNVHFNECKFRLIFDKVLIKKISTFAGWNFIGASSGILRDQGINVLFNIFCGLTVNAAQGIAMQVKVAISGFANSFVSAINPQIIKAYATNNREYLMKLVFQGARFSFYLLLFITLPILFETETLLRIWLNIVPEHTVTLVRLIVIYVISESVSYTLVTTMLATGNIRNYQLLVGGCQMLNFPLAYIILKLGYPPEYAIVISIIIAIICLCLRLYMLRKMVGLQVIFFLRYVILNIFIVSLLSCIVPSIVCHYLPIGIKRFTVTIFVSLISTSFIIFFVGCSNKERRLVIRKIVEKFT